MKANELRIGNYYNEFGIPMEADALLLVKLSQIEAAGKIPIDVSPIEITEEWLLKFGFEKEYESFRRVKYTHFEKFEFGYDINKDDFQEMVGFRFYGHHLPNIKYIHQLQNLFFALTGEELTLKQ